MCKNDQTPKYAFLVFFEIFCCLNKASTMYFGDVSNTKTRIIISLHDLWMISIIQNDQVENYKSVIVIGYTRFQFEFWFVN